MTLTKPGPYGTLTRYCVRYRDLDPACPVFTWSTWAYERDHAIEKFYDSSVDDNDWHVISVSPVAAARRKGGVR